MGIKGSDNPQWVQSGAALRNWRRNLGLTQAEFGERYGLRPERVSDIELGKRPSSTEIMAQLRNDGFIVNSILPRVENVPIVSKATAFLHAIYMEFRFENSNVDRRSFGLAINHAKRASYGGDNLDPFDYISLEDGRKRWAISCKAKSMYNFGELPWQETILKTWQFVFSQYNISLELEVHSCSKGLLCQCPVPSALLYQNGGN